MLRSLKISCFFIIIFLSFSQKANAVTFKNFDELNACVEFYNSFLQYKKNFTRDHMCKRYFDILKKKHT